MKNEIVIRENEVIRIYTMEEYEKYFNKKKYVSLEKLLIINKRRITPKLHQRENKNSWNIDFSRVFIIKMVRMKGAL